MPDVIDILYKRWKTIAALTLGAALLALLISLLRPKEYLSTVTALPANSALADKARVFNNSIEALYPEIGSPDELDRIEGTAKLDTIYLFIAQQFNLVDHYQIAADSEALYKAAMKLKKTTDIRRSAYGELKINVWDKNPAEAAQLANALIEKLNSVHQSVQTSNNEKVLAQLQAVYAQKQQTLDSFQRLMSDYTSSSLLRSDTSLVVHDSALAPRRKNIVFSPHSLVLLKEHMKEFQKIISQYELAVSTSILPLIVVENARPSLQPDRPRIAQAVLFAFGASLIFSILLSVFAESRYWKR